MKSTKMSDVLVECGFVSNIMSRENVKEASGSKTTSTTSTGDAHGELSTAEIQEFFTPDLPYSLEETKMTIEDLIRDIEW